MTATRPAAALAGTGVASDYAETLLASLGVRVVRRPGAPDPPPAALWAASGAMALTGHADGPPRLAPGPLAACAVGALRALAALAPGARLPRDAALLGERAAYSGARRRGRIAPGGSCRLLPSADGWIALNLARAEDVAALPAWLEAPPLAGESAWQHAARLLRERDGASLAQRAAWLGLPMAAAAPPPSRAPEWLRSEKIGLPVARAAHQRPRIVDLSGLWAGPLASSLLQACGARVWKVESRARPDGARRGPRRFFDLLNAGKASIALDFGTERELAQLRALIARADLVIESARPRALAQLGIDAERELARHPGLSWLSLTGYGRGDPAPGRVAFGDDAAVAAGLAEATGRDEGAPLFCGDAIADPLAGLHAAVAALASWRVGGGRLLDLSLRDVVAHALLFAPGAGSEAALALDRHGEPLLRGEGWSVPVAAPRARRPAASARALGADNARVLNELERGC